MKDLPGSLFFLYLCRYITSDCDAVATIFEYQGYTKSPEEAVADAIKAGPFEFFLHLLTCKYFFFLNEI